MPDEDMTGLEGNLPRQASTQVARVRGTGSGAPHTGAHESFTQQGFQLLPPGA